jgi:hypothetical protein
MGTLAYLFKYRERPNFLSRRWIKVWLKRIFTALDLVCLQFQRKLLIMSGMQIGQLSDLHKTVVQGAPVTASKDDAPAAVQAAIHNVAGLGSSSIGGGLIQTTSG